MKKKIFTILIIMVLSLIAGCDGGYGGWGYGSGYSHPIYSTDYGSDYHYPTYRYGHQSRRDLYSENQLGIQSWKTNPDAYANPAEIIRGGPYIAPSREKNWSLPSYGSSYSDEIETQMMLEGLVEDLLFQMEQDQMLRQWQYEDLMSELNFMRMQSILDW